MKQLTIYFETDSNIESSPTPDFIAVTFTKEIMNELDKAHKFLNDNLVDCCIWFYKVDFCLYQESDSIPEDEIPLKITNIDGVELGYVMFKTLRTDLTRLKLSKDGKIKLTIEVKHSYNEIWTNCGSLKTLQELFSAL